MNSFEVNTSQNVSISYEISGIGDRILAHIIDTLLKIGYVFFIILIIASLDKADNAFVWIGLGILAVPFLLYSLLFEIFMEGQTPGKRFRKIKVVNVDGSPPTFGAYLIRWIFRLVDINLFSGLVAIITIVAGNKGQRLGDILAKTTVINVRDIVTLKDTLYQKINTDYTIKYREVEKLDSRDVELIRKVLNSPQYRDNFEMLYGLTNKIQAKMGVSRIEGPEDFLETVVKDYNLLSDEG